MENHQGGVTVELNKETRQRYQNRMLEAMKEQGKAKLNCDFFAKKIGISRDYVLQLMRTMAEQGLVEFEEAKRAPEKKSWIRLKSSE
jgi:DNA-binding IscR family transcriptional regulator